MCPVTMDTRMKAVKDMAEMSTAPGKGNTAPGERSTALAGKSTALAEASTAQGETTKGSVITETSSARANMAMRDVTNPGPGFTSTGHT